MSTEIPWAASSPEFDKLWSDEDGDALTNVVPDMLATIFTQQRALMDAVWIKEVNSGLSIPTKAEDWGRVEMRAIQGRIHETFGHLVRELSEAMAHLDGSKSWKAKPRDTNVEEFYEEIADALHFFVEFCILAGLDAESLFREYFAKSLVNFDRNASGY